MVLVVKTPPANAGDVRFEHLIPELERSPGGSHSSILAWRIPMDTGVWRAAVHGVANSQTQQSD